MAKEQGVSIGHIISIKCGAEDGFAIDFTHNKKFNANDFAKHHPGGALGKKLYLTIGQIAAENLQPQVGLDTTIDQVLDEITTKRLGTTIVLENDKIKGIVTDGDIRRMLKEKRDIHKLVAKDIMSPSPILLKEEVLAVKALSIFEEKSINHIIVVDKDRQYKGIVHILDLIKEGISE